MTLTWFRSGMVGSAFVLAATACGPVIPDAEGSASEGEDTTGGGTEVTSVTDATMTSTTTVGTTDGTTGVTTTPTTTTGVTTTASTTDPTVSTVTTDPTIDPDPTGDGFPNGSQCSEDLECASGFCFVLGVLGGICGECVVDQDCAAGGCSLPNPLAQPPTGSFCNVGDYGAGCMSDAACQPDLVCAEVINVPGILVSSTCSECRDAGDCADGWSCEPDIAVAALTGVKRCVAPATLANGQTCDFAEDGDAACASGHCAIADVMGVLSLGVCSACETDDDCGDAMICEPPQVDLMAGAIPGQCV